MDFGKAIRAAITTPPCPYCGKVVGFRRDGKLRKHTVTRNKHTGDGYRRVVTETCEGSGQ